MDGTPPYLRDGRLADVIAAVTVLGTHRSSEKSIDGWSRELAKPKKDDADRAAATQHWRQVFEEHPEFFVVYQLSGGQHKAALRLRYANKTIDRDTMNVHERLSNLTAQERANLTSLPLAEGALTTLVSSAINLHSATIARNVDARQWVVFVGPVLSLLSGVLVAALAAYLAKPAPHPNPQQIELLFPPGGAAPIVPATQPRR